VVNGRSSGEIASGPKAFAFVRAPSPKSAISLVKSR
jgi:hypothetical protein